MTQNIIKHLSEKPWSDYTAADYSIEQWHAACLIHQHEGPPTSKSQCKLPVKTPGGAINRNGVHAAAAALAGARGGVNASSSGKFSAAKALIRYYNQMDEKPPPSLLKHSIIEHFGKKGMKWGVRKKPVRESSDFKQTKAHRGKPVKSLTNKQLKDVNARLNLEQNYKRLNPSTIQKGHSHVKGIIATGTAVGSLIALAKTSHGQFVINKGKKLVMEAIKRGARKPKSGQLTLF